MRKLSDFLEDGGCVYSRFSGSSYLRSVSLEALSSLCCVCEGVYVCTYVTCMEAGGHLLGIPPQTLSISWIFVLRQRLSLYIPGESWISLYLNSLCVLRQGLSLPYLDWLASEPRDPLGRPSMCPWALVFMWVLRVELRSSHCMASVQTEPYPQAFHCLFVSLEHHDAPSGGARVSLQLGHPGPGRRSSLSRSYHKSSGISPASLQPSLQEGLHSSPPGQHINH